MGSNYSRKKCTYKKINQHTSLKMWYHHQYDDVCGALGCNYGTESCQDQNRKQLQQQQKTNILK